MTLSTPDPIKDEEESEKAEERSVLEREGVVTEVEKNLHDRIAQLELDVKRLTEANEELNQQKNCVHRDTKATHVSFYELKDNSKRFRFYTGLSDYETFAIIFESFGSAVDKLVYIGSNTNASKITSADYMKRGPKRSLSAEQEFLYVLVQVRLGLLEDDIAYRIGISTAQFSRIWVTWPDFLHSTFRAYPL